MPSSLIMQQAPTIVLTQVQRFQTCSLAYCITGKFLIEWEVADTYKKFISICTIPTNGHLETTCPGVQRPICSPITLTFDEKFSCCIIWDLNLPNGQTILWWVEQLPSSQVYCISSPKCKSHDLSCNAYFVQPILLYQPALLRYEVESVDCMHTSLQTFWQKHLTNCVVITKKNKV